MTKTRDLAISHVEQQLNTIGVKHFISVGDTEIICLENPDIHISGVVDHAKTIVVYGETVPLTFVGETEFYNKMAEFRQILDFLQKNPEINRILPALTVTYGECLHESLLAMSETKFPRKEGENV